MSQQAPPPSPQPGWPAQPAQQEPVQPRRRPRVFMWVILAINLLFLIWLVSALGSGSSCEQLTGDELTACQAGEGIGKGIAFIAILLLWALVDVILGVIFLVTRRRN